jgi:hypothetical protein
MGSSISRSGRRYTSLFFSKVLGVTGPTEEVPRERLTTGVSEPRRCPKDGLICALPACVTDDICIERFEEEGL